MRNPSRLRLASAALVASLALGCGSGSGAPGLDASREAATGLLGAEASATVDLTIMGTTDLHGHIYPTNYTGDAGNEPVGLARTYTQIKAIRAQHPGHTLLVDSGDALEGTPLDYFNARVSPDHPNPMIEVMNYIGYDAFAVGNHDYNFGIPYLMRAKAQAKFPLMSANIYAHGTQHPVFLPYRIIPLAGVKVGILALTTPGIALWDHDNVTGQHDFGDIVAAAKHWVPEVRARGADVVVVAMHSGLGAPYDQTFSGYSASAGLPPENAACAVAEQVLGVDAIFSGHAHKDIPQYLDHNVPIVQGMKWGMRLAVLDLHLAKVKNRWTVAAKSTTTVNTEAVPPAPEILELAKATHAGTEAYVNTVIGQSAAAWTAHGNAVLDTPVIDLMNQSQLWRSGADLSATSAIPDAGGLPQGPITIANISGLLPYENTLAKVQVTGAQVRSYLEFTAKVFNPYAQGQPIFNPGVPLHDYDIVAGVSYQIDTTKPLGSRITGLSFKGQPVLPNQTFSMAINSYRKNGGGGYTMVTGAPVLQSYSDETRDVMINYIKQAKAIDPAAYAKPQWGVLPAGAADPNGNLYR